MTAQWHWLRNGFDRALLWNESQFFVIEPLGDDIDMGDLYLEIQHNSKELIHDMTC